MPRPSATRPQGIKRDTFPAISSHKWAKTARKMVPKHMQVKMAWKRTYQTAPVERLRRAPKWSKSYRQGNSKTWPTSLMHLTDTESTEETMYRPLFQDDAMHTRSGRTRTRPWVALGPRSSGRRELSCCKPPISLHPSSSGLDKLYPGTKISQAAADRAARADPNEGRCMLTGRTDNVRPVCVVPWDTPEGQVVTLEKAWGYDQKALHVEGRHNIIFLHESLYDSYQSHEWMLFPDPDITRTLHRHCQKNLNKKPSNIISAYQLDEKSLSFTYHAVPTVHSKHPELFETLGPLRSHLYPHFAIFRGAETRSQGSYGENDDLIVPFLVNNAGMCMYNAQATLGNMTSLRRHWLADEKWNLHRSAPGWKIPRGNFNDGDESIYGRHRPSPNSTCGWFSDIMTITPEDAERPRPHLPDIPFVDPLLRVQAWVQESSKCQQHGSHEVLQAKEARARLSDSNLLTHADLPTPSWIKTINWRSHSWSLPRLLDADDQSDGESDRECDSDTEGHSDREGHGKWDYAAFCSMDWAFHLTKCKLWL